MNTGQTLANAEGDSGAKTAQIDKAGYGAESELWNAVLVVEKQNIYVNKDVMMLASPVFKQMFTAPFKETQSDPVTVELPAKTINGVILMLDYLYPDRTVGITDKRAAQMLPFAEEYQMLNLKETCARELTKMAKPRLEILTLAERYNLPQLLQKAIDSCACKLEPGEIERQLKMPINEGLSDGSVLKIYKMKLQVTNEIIHEIPGKINAIKGDDNPLCSSKFLASRYDWKEEIDVIPKVIKEYEAIYGRSQKRLGFNYMRK